MKYGAIIGGVVGVALSAWLLTSYGAERILDVLGRAGAFGFLAVISFHFIQILFSALSWRAITGPAAGRPGVGGYMVLRWMREAINNLLPVAQIGGEFVVARLLRRRGMGLSTAIAGTIADLTMEMLTQIAFTVLGLALLLHSKGSGTIAHAVIAGLLTAAVLAAVLLGAQWFGLSAIIETALLRQSRAVAWVGAERLDDLQQAFRACYRAPGRLLAAAAWQMISWLLGGIEVCLALHFLGAEVGIAAGLVIESIGQALKSVGFAVPGALGVQEGGYIVICQAYGLSPEIGIALSLMKRLRELSLGVPALLAWQWTEWGHSRLDQKTLLPVSTSASDAPE